MFAPLVGFRLFGAVFSGFGLFFVFGLVGPFVSAQLLVFFLDGVEDVVVIVVFSANRRSPPLYRICHADAS